MEAKLYEGNFEGQAKQFAAWLEVTYCLDVEIVRNTTNGEGGLIIEGNVQDSSLWDEYCNS